MMAIEQQAAGGAKLERELAVLLEVERFEPPSAFREQALLKDPAVYERAARMGLEMPITDEVYRVLYEGKEPRAAVTDLMLRTPKGEK